MITFSKLEKKGHLGNQLFQIASTIGIAKTNSHFFNFPKWKYASFFKNQLPFIESNNYIEYKENQYHFKQIALDNKNYDLEGYFQSEKYFDLEKTRRFFEFKENFLSNIKEKNKKIFLKKTILISIRRGDFVDHKDYFQLPINYYLNALFYNFPDWSNCNLVVFSDDINYCKFHFSFLKNVYFSDSMSAIEQLALSSLCDHFIISNSTFSWWCAWLGEKKESKIIRPLHNFTREKSIIDNDQDYFPDRWVIYNHLNIKINIENTIFILRKKNNLLESFLQHTFLFKEIKLLKDLEDINEKIDSENFILMNDYVVPPLCLYEAVKCQEDKIESVFYLKGKPINISRILDKNIISRQFDFGIFSKIMKKNTYNNNKITLFICLNSKNFSLNNPFNKNNFNYFNHKNFKPYYSYCTKIKGIFEVRNFFYEKKRKSKIYLKTEIKKMFFPKKK